MLCGKCEKDKKGDFFCKKLIISSECVSKDVRLIAQRYKLNFDVQNIFR